MPFSPIACKTTFPAFGSWPQDELALPALIVGRQLAIPVVYEVRAFWEDAAVDHGTSHEGGLRYRVTRALESFVLHRARHVTTICEGLKGDILARGIPMGGVTVIPN